MNTAYILAGTNLGNRLAQLQQAKEHIAATAGNVIATSSIYQTAAWGVTDQPDFLNIVFVVETSLAPEALMQHLLNIEATMGRQRSYKFAPRTIDLDILLIDDIILNTPLLTVPHPALPQRKFALSPLAEVAPHLLHPVEKKPISVLLEECSDPLDVQKISAAAG